MTLIDIIILSYSKNEYLKSLTKQTVTSLLESEDAHKICFNVIVIESNKDLQPFQFPNTNTIYPNANFGFNKFLNIGINYSKNPYICLCNNDLIFDKGWASEILQLMQVYPKLESVNPLCPDFYPTMNKFNNKRLVFANKKNIFQGVLTGWCIFTKRRLFKEIGNLDEQFDFWYADRDYGMTLLKHNITHALALRSRVTHLGSKSHNTLEEELDNFTINQKAKYDAKWGKDRWSFTRWLRFMFGKTMSNCLNIAFKNK